MIRILLAHRNVAIDLLNYLKHHKKLLMVLNANFGINPLVSL